MKFTLLLALKVGVVVLAVMIHRHRVNRSARRLAEERMGQSFADFALDFDGDGIPYDVLRATHAVLQQRLHHAVKDFPVRGKDDLTAVFGIPRNEVNSIFLGLVEGCGRQKPPRPALRRMPRIETVTDLVFAATACPPLLAADA